MLYFTSRGLEECAIIIYAGLPDAITGCGIDRA